MRAMIINKNIDNKIIVNHSNQLNHSSKKRPTLYLSRYILSVSVHGARRMDQAVAIACHLT